MLGLLIIMVLGTALALLFSAANVFFRDVSNAVSVLTNFVRFGVPMMYPYALVDAAVRRAHRRCYLLNPIAEAVLLIQRAFWVGDDRATRRSTRGDSTCPPHLLPARACARC